MTWLTRLFRRCDELACLAAYARRMRALADVTAHVKEHQP